jgi:hypothetical protein
MGADREGDKSIQGERERDEGKVAREGRKDSGTYEAQ